MLQLEQLTFREVRGLPRFHNESGVTDQPLPTHSFIHTITEHPLSGRCCGGYWGQNADTDQVTTITAFEMGTKQVSKAMMGPDRGIKEGCTKASHGAAPWR